LDLFGDKRNVIIIFKIKKDNYTKTNKEYLGLLIRDKGSTDCLFQKIFYNIKKEEANEILLLITNIFN
jgi:hypothetical protein